MSKDSSTALYWAHETAIVDAGARVGRGTRIWHWAHVCATSEIGENCSLGQNVYVGHARIGNNVKIQNNVSVYDAVELEDEVFCGPSMVFTNVVNPRSHIVRKHEYRPTVVRRGASIGANAVIVCGNTIGSYAMVGAGAVVTKNVADYALVAGNPARQIGWICACGIRLPRSGGLVTCNICKSNYKITGTQCTPVQGR
jgi:UDP-2-acetamido-3-amino-2,3-dideoxy-glucuronate N-acetyltransferase